MHLVKKLSDNTEVYASDQMKIQVEDYILIQKSNAFHFDKAKELSQNNLPFAKMQRAKETRADERDITNLTNMEIPLRKTQAFKTNDKPTKVLMNQGSLLKAHQDLVNQCNYIRTKKAVTEQSLINGTTCLKEVVNKYNSLAQYYQTNHKKVSDLLNQAFAHKKSYHLEVKKEELHAFEADGMEIQKKELYELMSELKEDNEFGL